jgi:hypothetical protein
MREIRAVSFHNGLVVSIAHPERTPLATPFLACSCGKLVFNRALEAIGHHQ